MKAYPTYKPSGIDWLGEIPSHWARSKYKYHAESRMGITILREQMDIVGVPIYSATQNDDILGYISEPSLILKKGDLVIPARGNSIGYVSKVSYPIATCTQTTICSTNFKGICVEYLYYCCSAFKDVWFFFEDTAIPQITVSQVDNNTLPLPPMEEQESIAEYLDEKTEKIDALVAEKQTQVDELRNYRTSLIAETVTRGLNPDANFKKTLSRFIPQIPEHWSLDKFKYQASIKSNLVHPEEHFTYPQISPDMIEKETGRLINYKNVEEAGIISDNHLFYKGQIIYSKIRPNLNKLIIAPFDGLCSADMYPIETNNNIVFFKYLMLSTPFVDQVSAVISDRVKMPKINQEEMAELLVPIPPISEQQDIADFLDAKTSKIDETIAELETQISELTEYKKAVITEAVTGKVDVRGWKHKE